MAATLSASYGALCPAATASAPAAEAVLVVEDDPCISGLFALLLAPVALRVVQVNDAAGALRWYQTHAAATALAIVDCSLPDVHGGMLALRLRAASPGLPVLLMSGRPQPDVVRLLALEGPADFLAKPFRPAEVLPRVRALLAPRRAA